MINSLQLGNVSCHCCCLNIFFSKSTLLKDSKVTFFKKNCMLGKVSCFSKTLNYHYSYNRDSICIAYIRGNLGRLLLLKFLGSVGK